jgi:hypothetical protein
MRARVLRHGKFGSPMSLMGQTRSFGDVGSMSGLPESGRAADTGGRLESAWHSLPRSLNGTIWNIGRASASASRLLDVGGPDHLAPFLGFVGDELAKVSGRTRKRCAPQSRRGPY